MTEQRNIAAPGLPDDDARTVEEFSPPTSPAIAIGQSSAAEDLSPRRPPGSASRDQYVAELEGLVISLRREHIGSELVGQRVTQLEAELKILRTEKRNADLEIVELQALLRTAQANLQSVHATVSYRVGKIFVIGFTSWRGLLLLPGRLGTFLWKHFRSSITQRGAKHPHALAGASRQGSAVADALSEVRRNGPEKAVEWARSQNFDVPLLARILLEIARVIRKTDVKMAIALGKEGISLAPSEQRIKWLAFALADAGATSEPADLLRRVIDAGVALNGTETRRADELFALDRIAKCPLSIPPRCFAVRKPLSRRVLIVAGRSLPFHWTSATMRIHAAAVALKGAGWMPEVVTMPGYPLREGDEKPLKDLQGSIDGITYHRLPAAVVSPQMIDLYLGEAAAMIAKLAAELDTSIIHAPSDFLTAQAALAAARMIDAPFVLDHAERVPEIAGASVEYQQSERFGLYQKMQQTLAQEADAVIARTALLRQMLLDGGVAGDSVRQLFDSVTPSDVARSRPIAAQHPALASRRIIGYIGEAGAEFDLQILSALLSMVVKGGVNAALHVVGTGAQFERLQIAAAGLGVGDRLVLPGRPKLGDIAGHYALMDIVVLPYRSRSWRAPYELVEAMAHGACIVCPDFADIREVLGDTGLVVGPDAMADAVIGLLNDNERRAQLAISARKRAAQLFDLEKSGHSLLQVYVQAWKRAGGVVGEAPRSSPPLAVE